MNESLSFRFRVLVAIVAISGFSQGMLLPLIAIILEQDGLSSSLNGLNATALYIGILLASPLMERPLQRIGYKPMIIIGGIIVALSLLLFPLWQSFWFWFILRMFIGIGDQMLHFSTQTWITSFSPPERRGRNISIYGVSFGIGFAAGPMMTQLISIHQALPFVISSLLSVTVWAFVFKLKNEFPEDQGIGSASFLGSFHRFGKVLTYAWAALLPPLGYGFLEASLNGNFPVFALRNGLSIDAVAILLPAFAIGSIISQVPLGMLSDRHGRQPVLLTVMMIGFLCFSAAGIVSGSTTGLFICFTLAGMAVGSTFSLGISYMTDLLPKELLPAGNIMCGIFFSFGSMIGPFVGGLTIDWLKGSSFFYLIAFMMFLIFISLLVFTFQHRRGEITQNN
ncbi:MFS transporter [Bacillus sp. KH172YL63]|uniref:MFS transporter n=1 Tax=Bacillus sp. KH172YL63 TaxID=2709784 RepID=UPI0013E47368|nr:MFS transporter [Bacillus sp. KH172YL63]BCB02496.1 putative MFS-type transporter YfkF [Bacillus sp. KH172YL63]